MNKWSEVEKEFDKLWEELYLNGWSYPKGGERKTFKSFFKSQFKQMAEVIIGKDESNSFEVFYQGLKQEQRKRLKEFLEEK